MGPKLPKILKIDTKNARTMLLIWLCGDSIIDRPPENLKMAEISQKSRKIRKTGLKNAGTKLIICLCGGGVVQFVPPTLNLKNGRD